MGNAGRTWSVGPFATFSPTISLLVLPIVHCLERCAAFDVQSYTVRLCSSSLSTAARFLYRLRLPDS
jgi:hypothetical protein